MTCDETRVLAYLAGDLDRDATADFERHLLACESCWAAVRDDRRGRQLAEQLRTIAPHGLRDRVRANIELATGSKPARRVLPLRVLAAIAAAIVVIAGGAFLGLHRGGDPAVVSDVVALAAHHERAAPTVRTYGGHRVEITTHEMHGQPVVMATSDTAFPMPGEATALGSAHGEPWMAHRGGVSVVCLDHPNHVLIAGRMPPSDLLEFARGLGYTA
jgi:anti-sigma factor RsiW